MVSHWFDIYQCWNQKIKNKNKGSHTYRSTFQIYRIIYDRKWKQIKYFTSYICDDLTYCGNSVKWKIWLFISSLFLFRQEVKPIQNMYGQKQIIQCAALAVFMFVLNFHRSALKQNKAIAKVRVRRLHQSNIVNGVIAGNGDELAFNSNLTGYCLKNPFGKNIYGNYDNNNNTHCHNICFDKFETWLYQQCKANCCVFKCTTSIACQLNIDSVRKSTTIHSKKTRTRTHNTALIVYVKWYEERSAGLYNGNQQQLQQQQFELFKAISDPIKEKVLDWFYYQQSNEHDSQNRHFTPFIRKNTTSVKRNQIKLEKNQSHPIMEYHDFLFDMGIPEPKHRSSLPPDSGM